MNPHSSDKLTLLLQGPDRFKEANQMLDYSVRDVLIVQTAEGNAAWPRSMDVPPWKRPGHTAAIALPIFTKWRQVNAPVRSSD